MPSCWGISLPKEWSCGEIGSVCIKTKMRDPSKNPDEEFEYVDVSSVSNESFTITSSTTTLGIDAPSRARKAIEADDVLYATVRPYLKRVAKVPSSLNGQIASTGFCVVRSDKKKTSPEFLYYLLLTEQVNVRIKDLQRGSSYPAVSDKEVLGQLVPLPSLPEQRSIAVVLSKIQEAIAAQQEIIDQTAELKQSLMAKIFIQGLRDEPTKETEVGPIPESWEFSTLGKLCTESGGRIQTGPFGSQLHSHEYEESGLPVVNPTHMLGNRINQQNIPKISIETAARLTRHELRDGDILFARRGVIGRHGLVGKNEVGWICGTGCFLVRLTSERIINKFLSFFIATQPVVAWLNSNAAGAIMPNLNSQVIGRIPVYFPPKPEQEQIVGLLTGLDDKVDAAEVKKEVLQDLFKTMLHELMTGSIRTTSLMEA